MRGRIAKTYRRLAESARENDPNYQKRLKKSGTTVGRGMFSVKIAKDQIDRKFLRHYLNKFKAIDSTLPVKKLGRSRFQATTRIFNSL